MPTTRSYSQNLALCFSKFLKRDGSMRSARCILMRRCTHSGITDETDGDAMPAFALIICYSTRKLQSALQPPAWIAKRGGSTARAIMHLHGSSFRRPDAKSEL